MAQRKPEDLSFDQVRKLVDALVPEERARLYRHLQFRFWDEEFAQVQRKLNEERAAAGLPAATDEDVHDAIDSMRTAEDWNELRREIQKGVDELDRGEGIPAEAAIAELRERNKTFRKASK
jgi:hypothetical protein